MQLNPNQQKAVDFFKGNCNVIATAGSGKSATIVGRIANLVKQHGINPENILAVTFSKKAKENMAERLEVLLPGEFGGLNIHTFHSLGYRLIRQFDSRDLTVISSKVDKVNILKAAKLDVESVANEVIGYISFMKNSLIMPGTKSVAPENQWLEHAYIKYEAEKDKQGALDFDDMLFLAHKILKGNKKALDYCGEKYKFILVDEAQDINKAQYEILRLIGKENNNVFIVSDPLQNIYNFRGSDSNYVIQFDENWEGAGLINLDINYRSSKNIVDLSNRYARTIKESKHKFYVETKADKPSYKDPVLTIYNDEYDEAISIAVKINELASLGEYDYKDFGVLARTNAQLQVYETAFFNAGIPYEIIGSVSFVSRKEIKIVLSYLRLANNMEDNESFRYIYWQPLRGLGKAFLNECEGVSDRLNVKSLYTSMQSVGNKRFKRGISGLTKAIERIKTGKWRNVGEQVRYLRETLDIDDYVLRDIYAPAEDDSADNEKQGNLDSLEKLASKFKTLQEFIDYLDGFSKSGSGSKNCVKVSTIHKSKGLEYPVVFVIGINDDVFPHTLNDNVEEEKRLCYVAITRAEKELFCSGTEKKGKFLTALFGQAPDDESAEEPVNDPKPEETEITPVILEGAPKKAKQKKHNRAFREALEYLGPDYTAETIDGELCLYRNLGTGFDIEVRGLRSEAQGGRICNYICVWDISGISSVRPITVEYVRHDDVQLKCLADLERELSLIAQKYGMQK